MMNWITILAATIGAIATVILSKLMLRRRENLDRVIQGDICVSAAIISLLSLFLPWLNNTESTFSGFDINLVFTPSMRPFVMLIPILALLTLFGGILHLAGYTPGKKIISTSPLIGILLTLAFAFSFWIPSLYQANVPFDLNWGAIVYIYGSIMSAVSGKLERSRT